MSSGAVPSATVDGTDEDIRELTVRLQHCSVTVRIEPSETSASASRQAPPAPSDGESVRARVPLAGSSSSSTVLEDDLRVLDLSSPTELGALDLGHLNSLAASLGACSGGWTARARLGRAYRAGVSARLVVQGRFDYQQASATLDVRNKFYVCLRCSKRPSGFWTSSARTYFTNISGPSGEKFCPTSVSHAFSSKAEVFVFLAGAQATWPEEL